MSEVLAEQPLQPQASELEKRYDWLASATLYKEELNHISDHDLLRRRDLHECLAYALHRAARQTSKPSEFRSRTEEAISNYHQADALHRDPDQRGIAPARLRCQALTALLQSFIAEEARDKTGLLDQSWSLGRDSLKLFFEQGNAKEYWRTFSQLAPAITLKFRREIDYHARKNLLREAIDAGEQSIRFNSKYGKPDELACSYSMTACYLVQFAEFLQDPDEGARYSQKSQDYWMKGLQISEENCFVVQALLMLSPLIAGWGSDEALDTLNKSLVHSKKTRDRLVVGGALDGLAMHTIWRTFATEDPAERRRLADKALQYSEEARQEYSSISFVSPRGGALWVESPYAEYLWELARQEVDLEKRAELLRKAVEASKDLLERAENSGYPEISYYGHHVFSKNLIFLAKTVARPEEKKSLLEEALAHRNEAISINDRLSPFGYFNRGAFGSQLADIKSELALLDDDSARKRKLLEEAASDKELAIKLGLQEVIVSERTGALTGFVSIGRWQREYGDLLRYLSELANNASYLAKAAEVYEAAAESFQKLHLASRIAECFWKAAISHDGLHDHLKSAGNFQHASENYQIASEKIPQLADVYLDYASYMQAWSNIEKARYHHGRQEYSSASGFYSNAKILHESSGRWNYLAQNYEAWSLVENAEDLSRKEKGSEARKVFEEAARLFSDAKHSLQRIIDRIEDSDERHMVSRLIEAADLRREYCSSRILVEEAKTLDRDGDARSASEKYGQAVNTLEKIAASMTSEDDRRELRIIATLCSAWQMMTRAQAEASPGFYLEASKLFEDAKALSLDENAKLMALGHSRFCRALEAGTRFTDNKDEDLYSVAVGNLESAADHYVKAGLQNYSDYARASRLFFDSYAYMNRAAREMDQEKKAKLYSAAEKMLQASAESYEKAGQVQRKERVERLIERIEEERELAVSLTELLAAPTIVSSTRAFSTPTPSHEKAVGLERFEYAEIETRAKIKPRNLKVGERLVLEIELANAGRSTAQLVKMEGAIIEGFEISEKPERYRLEDGHVDMNGRQLAPEKTEKIRLALTSKAEGLFTFKPRIVYLDDSGHYRSNEAEPTIITVSPIFEFLVNAFVNDYLEKRLSFKEAGWRSLMEIVDSLKMPRSKVYGDPRYGHTFGTPLETLVKKGLIEYRRFSRERGRGGQVIKIRVCYDKEDVTRLVDELTLKPLKGT